MGNSESQKDSCTVLRAMHAIRINFLAGLKCGLKQLLSTYRLKAFVYLDDGFSHLFSVKWGFLSS